MPKIETGNMATEKVDAITRLAEIDSKSIRSLRAIAAGKGTDEDREFLAKLEAEASELRAKLA